MTTKIIGNTIYHHNEVNKLHRLDGPVAEGINGFFYEAWYLNGIRIGSSCTGFTQEKFERYLNLKCFL